MDEKSLYAHILNLTAPWQVKFITRDEKAGSVTVTVELNPFRELWKRRYDEHSRGLWLEWMVMAKNVGVPLLTGMART